MKKFSRLSPIIVVLCSAPAWSDFSANDNASLAPSSISQSSSSGQATSADDVDVSDTDIALSGSAQKPQIQARNRRVIEEVVVTAQKTQQTLQEVPVAVTVVSGETMRQAGIFGPQGLENLVPNLEMDSDAQSPTIGIRGFSTDTYNSGLEPSVGIIIDEIPLGRTEFIPDGLFDVERVEVLRGPQGTLFGKNTIAGVLIFGTGEPQFDKQGSVTSTGGDHETKRVEGFQNFAITENLLGRAALVVWHDGGEVDNSFLQREELQADQYAGRIKLAWDMSDALRLRGGVQISSTDTDYPGFQAYDLDPNALAYSRSKDPDTEDNPFDSHTSFDYPGFVERDTILLHGIADYTINEDLDVSVIAGHAGLDNLFRIDFDVSAADLVKVNVDFQYQQDSLELRFVGRNTVFGSDIEFVGGLFGFQSKLKVIVDVEVGDDIVDFAATPAGIAALGGPDTGLLGPLLNSISLPSVDIMDGLNQHFDQDSESIAAFGQVTWALTDDLALVTGLRIGQEKKNAVLSILSRGPGLTALVLGADSPDPNFTQPLSRKESEVSPKLGFNYAISDNISSYLSWTRGYKGGGFNAISFNSEDLVFEPETGDNYELGIKSRLFEDTLAFNATIYHTDVTNMQVVNFNGVSFDVFNAAVAVLEGFEADFSWLTPLEWLSVNGAFALSRAEYTRYTGAPAPNGEGDANGEQDLSGKTLPKAPVKTLSLSPTVSLPLGANLGLQFAMDVSHRGEQYLSLDLDEKAYQKAHTLIGARVSVAPESERWSVTLRAENITNENVLTFVADHNLYANSYFATQASLSRYSLSVSFNW